MMKTKPTCVAIIFGLTIVYAQNSLKTFTRSKRHLIFTPRSSIVQLILGTGIPVPLENDQALTIGYVFKASYNNINNASFFTDPYIIYQKRSLEEAPRASRFDLYKSMETIFSMFGGKGCVLRAVCETAQTPFKASGVLGKILHIIFSPTTTDEHPRTPSEREYMAASMMGSEHGANCLSLYPECRQSLLDIITVAI